MSEQAGPVCPECGSARLADGTPACPCTRRASDAHRANRSAQAAAAEDFDPVRIRPYVEVGDDSDAPDVAMTATESIGERVDEEAPTPPTRSLPAPASADSPDSGTPDRRSRRALTAVGLAVAVAAALTGCIVGGLLWYDGPERDSSSSGGVRAGLPVAEPSDNTPTSTDTSPSATPTTRPSASADTSSPATEHPPTRTANSTGTTTPTATDGPAPSTSGGQSQILRYGDQGPEVTELQLRLSQIGFYAGEADGTYSREVENAVRSYQVVRLVLADESGVYGTATRAALEAETSEP